MHEIEARREEADRQLAAVIYLMSCHARTRCPRLATLVQRHLVAIGRNPGTGEHVRETCQRLSAAWACVCSYDERLAAQAAPRGGVSLH